MEQEKKQVRNHDVKILFSKEEMEKLERKSKVLGLKPSQFVRMVSLNCSINTGVKK